MKQAEPIIRRIFGFDNASSLGSAMASTALLMGSMKTAANAVKGANAKKAASKAKSGGSKPRTSNNANRNTTNMNGGNGSGNSAQNGSGNSNSAGPGSSTGGGQGSPAPGGSGQGSPAPSGSGQGSPQSRRIELDTGREGENENDSKFKKALGKVGNVAGKVASAEFKLMGAAMGMVASDDPVTGALTGWNYGTAFGEGAKNLGGGAVNLGRRIKNKATRGKTLGKQAEGLIDGYNDAKAYFGLPANLSEDQSIFMDSIAQGLLQEDDLSRISDPKLREYGTVLHNYRSQFEGRNYNNPDHMVLDALRKVESGELTKDQDSIKRYTRKK